MKEESAHSSPAEVRAIEQDHPPYFPHRDMEPEGERIGPSPYPPEPRASELDPHTLDLVFRFAQALTEKLAKAERKYGYSDGWRNEDWMDECREKLRHHLEKGDPLDVSAYCAFLWYHGESTATAAHASEQGAEHPVAAWERVLKEMKASANSNLVREHAARALEALTGCTSPALSQRPTPYTANEHDKTCICMYCKPELWPDDSEENKYRDLAAERWNQLEAERKRLDWLEVHVVKYHTTADVPMSFFAAYADQGLRAAIDAAMREEA